MIKFRQKTEKEVLRSKLIGRRIKATRSVSINVKDEVGTIVYVQSNWVGIEFDNPVGCGGDSWKLPFMEKHCYSIGLESIDFLD